MTPHRLLITGGAGFVGSNLAVSLAERQPDWEIVAFDNLHRKGSEMNLPRLEQAGVEFVGGDIREPAELDALGRIDAMVECSAEPTVLAGLDGDTSFVVHTNLTGAYHCLELCRRHGAYMVFLSTSRVYPIEPQTALAYDEDETRFTLRADQPVVGVSADGISEEFPLNGTRTLYGTTKLAAELLVEEWRGSFGLPAVVNRCGVIAGPWQMGKVDQGVFTHWMLNHHFCEQLSYIGYGGSGKQVRDLLHVDDLVDLVAEQLTDPGRWDGKVVNVGGGTEGSLSLLETTELCREITGNEVPIPPVEEARQGDVPIYVSDCSRLFELTQWRPRREPEQILRDIEAWIAENEGLVAESLGFAARRTGN
jgi:CDP-paratose 2-epimerase